MRNKHYLLVGLLFVLCVAVSAPGSTQDNPYDAIIGRNVFGLKNPPPPPDPNATQKVDPPKVELQGLTTILGRKQVFLKVAAKPPQQPKEESLVFDEGQRKGEIEVLSIDEKTGTVKLKIYDTFMTVNMADNAAKPIPGAAPAPGIPTPAPVTSYPGVPPPASAVASPGGVTTFGAGNKGLPPRPIRPTSESGGGVPLGGASGGATGQPMVTRTAEENVIMYEANRLKNEELRKAGARIPPMPHHILLKNEPK